MIPDPRTPEMKAAYDELLAKQRRDAFWRAVESKPAARPKSSAAAVVARLTRTHRRRVQR